jgi:hypothetical protein
MFIPVERLYGRNFPLSAIGLGTCCLVARFHDSILNYNQVSFFFYGLWGISR